MSEGSWQSGSSRSVQSCQQASKARCYCSRCSLQYCKACPLADLVEEALSSRSTSYKCS